MEREKAILILVAIVIVAALVVGGGLIGLPRNYIEWIITQEGELDSIKQVPFPSLGWVEVVFIFIWGFILWKKMRLVKYGPFPVASILIGLFLGFIASWTIPMLMIFSGLIGLFLLWPITKKIFSPDKVIDIIGDLLHAVDESGMENLKNRNLSILAGFCFGLGLVRGGLSYGFILYLALAFIVSNLTNLAQNKETS